MKCYLKILYVTGFIVLSGCSTDISRYQKQLEANGYTGSRVVVYPRNGYAQPPAKYVVDENGRYIDQNGNRTDSPVENPYYRKYIKRHK